MQANASFPLTGLTLDTEAVDCWKLAARVGANRPTKDEPARSFTSLLLALLYADNGWSRWFLRYATALSLPLPDITATLQFDPAQLKTMRAAEIDVANASEALHDRGSRRGLDLIGPKHHRGRGRSASRHERRQRSARGAAPDRGVLLQAAL